MVFESLLSKEKTYSPKDMSFEAQYSRKLNLNVNGAKVEAVSIAPENPKTKVPVLVLHGWGATMEFFKPGMEVLTKKGRPVLSLNFPRKGGNIPETHNADLEAWYREQNQLYPDLPNEFLRQAGTIAEFLDAEKIEKADIVAHPIAGITVVRVAQLHP